MIKVSIIVPVYNTEKYLHRCLKTLVNQTLKEIEIILVNDASTDTSLAILEEYKQKYPDLIVIINSKTNNKQGGARNLGIDIAKGEYIGFVDSDDWVDEEMFEKLYKKAKEQNSDIVDCDYFIATGVNERISREKSNDINQLGLMNIDKKKSLILNTGRMWTKIFKRSLIIENNIRFPKGVFYEYNEFMPLVMVYANHISKVDEPLYYYFIDNSQSTTKKLNSYRHFDRLITSKNMINNFKERGLFNIYKDEITFKFIELYYVNTIIICLTKFKPIEVKKLLSIRNYVKENYPDYKKNIYYKKSKFYIKVLCTLNDFSPHLLSILYRLTSLVLPFKTLKMIALKK